MIDQSYKPSKYHFEILPELKHELPVWKTNTDFCVAIPIWNLAPDTITADEKVYEFVRGMCKSAAWALYSWKQFTDAKEFSVKCCVTVHEEIYDTVMPILKQNSVDDSHIHVIDTSEQVGYAKCFSALFSNEFQKYKFLIIPDTDLFIVGNLENRLDLFSKIKSRYKYTKGIWMAGIHRCDNPIYRDIGDYWVDRIEFGNDITNLTKKDKAIIFTDKVSSVSDTSIGSKYIEGGYNYVNASIRVFDTEIFLKDLEWWKNASNVTRSDEAPVSIWSHMSSENNVYNIAADLNLEFKSAPILGMELPYMLHYFANDAYIFSRQMGINLL